MRRWTAEGVGRSVPASRQHEKERPVPSAKKTTSATKFHTVKKRKQPGPTTNDESTRVQKEKRKTEKR